MKIRVYSDLHWEMQNKEYRIARMYSDKVDQNKYFWVPPELESDSETTLILAGDLWYGVLSLNIIAEFNKRFKQVIVVLGNHDYWKNSHKTLPQEYRERIEFMGLDNVHLLDCDHMEIDGIIFYGGTMWTDINRGDPRLEVMLRFYMSPDCELIKGMNYNLWESEFKRFADNLKQLQYQNPDKKIVVVSHHLPSYESVHEKFRNLASRDMNFYFFSDCEYLMNEKIPLWVHGHTHCSFDYQLGQTRVFCNPRGYAGENFSCIDNIIEVNHGNP